MCFAYNYLFFIYSILHKKMFEKKHAFLMLFHSLLTYQTMRNTDLEMKRAHRREQAIGTRMEFLGEGFEKFNNLKNMCITN